MVLLDIDFEVENQDDIVRTINNLSKIMRERNIELSHAKELLYGGKIDWSDELSTNYLACILRILNENNSVIS